MKKLLIIILAVLLFTTSAFAEVGFEGRHITKNLWAPTGYTLNKGEFLVGLGTIGVGISENVQFGTNILLFLLQIYNANLKVNLINSPTMALATGIEYSRFNLSSLLEKNELAFNTVSPYLAVSTQVGVNTTLHLAGKYSYFSIDEDIEDYEAEGTTSGSEVKAGLEYSLSHKTKLLAEGGYDLTFDGIRLGGGVLFGWENFRLKLGVSYFAPENSDKGFTLPIIGLWWRFIG